jgi:hypothetical protein
LIDYQGIIEQLNTDRIIELMEKLGVETYVRRPGYVIFPTICHNEDATQASLKLYYYENNHLFVCYTEDGNMSIFKFLRHYYETRGIDFDWYEDIYKVVLDCSNFRLAAPGQPTYKSIRDLYRRPEQIQLPTYPEGILRTFTKFYPPEWLNDGISKQAMDNFNILYSIPQNKIIIPHYNIDNELVGVRGRAFNEWEVENIGKYMPVQIEGKWYSHPLSLNLYGLNKTKENIKDTGICFIFEAEKSVLQMDSFNRLNCAAAVCGSQFNKFALKILVQNCHPNEIVICFDKEELPGQDTYFYKLYNLCKKYRNYANFSFIYDMEGLLDLKDSPTDKGEAIFEELLKKRVRIK